MKKNVRIVCTYTRINQCQDHKINFRDKMKKINDWLWQWYVLPTKYFVKIWLQAILDEIDTLFHQINQNLTSDCHWISMYTYAFVLQIATGIISDPKCINRLQVNLCQKLFFLQIMRRTWCVQKLVWMSKTFSVHNMFSPGLSLEFSCIELVIQWTICRHMVG